MEKPNIKLSLNSEPNFCDEEGNTYLVRCPSCERENYSMNVSKGVCTWCPTNLNEIGIIWKDIIGYEDQYQISNQGQVKSLERIIENKGLLGNNTTFKSKEKILKNRINNGYNTVRLHKDKKGISFRVARLVGIHFIPNPENKREINHKSGNKLDDRAFMLEWSTPSENSQHAFDSGLSKKFFGKDNKSATPVIIIDKNGNFIKEFNTQKDLVKYLNLKSAASITVALKNPKRTARGYLVRLKSDMT